MSTCILALDAAKVAHLLDDHLRATLPETPPVAERPVGLVWHEGEYGWVSDSDMWWASVRVLSPSAYVWRISVRAATDAFVGSGDSTTLDAAKAAAEACLRAWVARLNASLGTP